MVVKKFGEYFNIVDSPYKRLSAIIDNKVIKLCESITFYFFLVGRIEK